MTISKVQDALEDAGYEDAVVIYKKGPIRGYFYQTNGEPVRLGRTLAGALKAVADMPNPNHVEKVEIPEVEYPEVDEFGNPLNSNFGVR